MDTPLSLLSTDGPGLALAARGLCYRYSPGSPLILDRVDHSFQEGRLTALTGASGCGKSTLLYLLAGMLTPTDGAIVAKDGLVLSAMPDWARAGYRAANFGFVFQDAMLDPSRTVLENVCESGIVAGWRRRSARARAHELLERFGLAHRADHRPGEVSGGQAQRVAICRALLTAPSIVFADEPTGNLDPTSAEVVISALEEAADQGACVLVATHAPEVAERCHEVLRLRVADEPDQREQTGEPAA